MSAGVLLGKLTAATALLQPPKMPATIALLAALSSGDATGSSILGCKIDPDTGRLMVDTGSSGATVIEGTTTPSDALANPTTAIDSASYTLAYNRAGGTWGRVDRYDLTTGSSGTNVASAGAAAKSAAHLLAYNTSGSQWQPLQTNGSGYLYTYPHGQFTVGDGRAALGQGAGVGNTFAFLGHRDQANNSWNASRGGYSGTIASSAVPYVLNTTATLARKTTAPAPADGELVAAQASARGAALVLQRLPDPTDDSADIPLVAYDTGVDQLGSSGVDTVCWSAFGTNDSGATLYLGIYSSAGALTSGVSVPRLAIRVAAGAQGVIGADYLSQRGIRCSAGLVVAWSTRFNDYTAPASATALSVGAVYNT